MNFLFNFAFDSRNRLIQAGSSIYRYDAENQRVGVNQTQYVVNSQPSFSQVLVKEKNGQKTFYVYGLGLIGQEMGSRVGWVSGRPELRFGLGLTRPLAHHFLK